MNGTTQSGTLMLANNSLIGYRPICPSDQTALQRFHSGLGNRSVYHRFFRLQPSLGDAPARYLTQLDGVDRFALVALDPCDPGTDRAEYAALVPATGRRPGLGLGLTFRHVEAARQRGIQSLYAFVLPDNVRMFNLVSDLNLPKRVRRENDAEPVEVGLGSPSPFVRHPTGQTPRRDAVGGGG